MGTDRKILSGFLGGLLFTAFTILGGFIQLRLLIRYFPQAEAGLWIVFQTIAGYIVLFDLGVSPTVGREVSFATQASPPERTRLIGTLLRTSTAAAAAVASLVFVAGMTGGWAYLKTLMPGSLQSAAWPAWTVFLLGACAGMVGQGWLAGILGLGEAMREKNIRSVGQILGIVLFVAAVFLHRGLLPLAIAFLLQAVFTVLLARRTLRTEGEDYLGAGRVDTGLMKSLAAPSLKYAAMVLGGILILQTDNLVIASRLGTGRIPDYQAISRLVTTLMTLSMMLIVTTTPFQSRAHAEENPAEVRRLLDRNLHFSLVTMVITGSVLACFADRLVAVWLGEGHFVGFGVVWVMLTVMLLEAHHSAMAAATMATGRIVFTVPALLAGVLNVVISVYLAGKLGLLGVALGTLCAQLVTNNWYVPFYTMRQFHISFGEHLRRVVGPLLLLLSVELLVGWTVRRATSSFPPVVSVVAGSVAALLVGVPLAFRVAFSVADRSALLLLLRTRLPFLAAGQGEAV